MKYFYTLFLAIILSLSMYGSVWADDVPYLLTVSSKGDVKSVKAMLETGANPNAQDIDGLTALMYATRKDKAEVVNLLLSKGADPNLRDSSGWTALMYAAKKNYLNCAKLLLSLIHI